MITVFRSCCVPVFCQCDDGVLVYDEQAGGTHLLDLGAWQVLLAILQRDGVATAEVGSGVTPDATESGQSEQVLVDALEAAGLIERCPV